MERVKLGILADGGLNSFLIWALYKEATNIYVRLGYKHQLKHTQAMFRLARLVPDFKTLYIDGPQMASYETPSGIIPMRNAELIISASHYADVIMLGVSKYELASDKSAEFLSAMETVLNVSWRSQKWNDNVGRSFQVHSPIRNYTRAQLVKLYIDHGNDPAYLAHTVDCVRPMLHHCGACDKCAQRWVALKLNKLQHINAWEQEPIKYIAKSALLRMAHSGHYPPEYAAEILLAVQDEGVPL